MQPHNILLRIIAVIRPLVLFAGLYQADAVVVPIEKCKNQQLRGNRGKSGRRKTGISPAQLREAMTILPFPPQLKRVKAICRKIKTAAKKHCRYHAITAIYPLISRIEKTVSKSPGIRLRMPVPCAIMKNSTGRKMYQYKDGNGG